jgi:predicted ArsR family transcriptional regulator
VATEDFDADVASVAALGEPMRRALYRYVVSQEGAVGREEAAAGVGVAHHTAKFHLDKLVEDGLLDVEYRRPPGRTGPGAGRPAKLYRRADREIAVSLPERRYDLAGRVMAEAITEARRAGTSVDDTLTEAARSAGREIGEQARGLLGSHRTPEDALRAVGEVLAGQGYEPRLRAGCLTLGNCPFHSLAQRYRDLVCRMNLDLIDGVLDGLEPASLHAILDPSADCCCVVVAPETPDPRPLAM